MSSHTATHFRSAFRPAHTSHLGKLRLSRRPKSWAAGLAHPPRAWRGARNITLDAHRYEDALAELVVVAWELSEAPAGSWPLLLDRLLPPSPSPVHRLDQKVGGTHDLGLCNPYRPADPLASRPRPPLRSPAQPRYSLDPNGWTPCPHNRQGSWGTRDTPRLPTESCSPPTHEGAASATWTVHGDWHRATVALTTASFAPRVGR